MKPVPYHLDLLSLIQKNSGKATQHTFLDNYLGSTHHRYAINSPTLRKISKEWMISHKDLSANDFEKLLTSLVIGKSHTEKIIVGALLDESTREQRKFDPQVFDRWLDHLEGWAEVDSICTGTYTVTEIPADWTRWKKLLTSFSKSKNIQKRRASLVLFCSPLRKPENEKLLEVALQNVERLKDEKEILITKAISWVLRSALPIYKTQINNYVRENLETLPKIAIRETLTKIKTGRKTGIKG